MQLLPLLAIPIGLALPLNICHQTPCKYQDAKELVSPCQIVAIPSELLCPRIIAITTLDAAVHGSPAFDLLIVLH